MVHLTPNHRKTRKRLSLHCRGLSLDFATCVGLRIAVRRHGPIKDNRNTQINAGPRILPLVPNSGPFFVYADPKQPHQNNRVDRRLSVVSFEHHKKMDHA